MFHYSLLYHVTFYAPETLTGRISKLVCNLNNFDKQDISLDKNILNL